MPPVHDRLHSLDNVLDRPGVLESGIVRIFDLGEEADSPGDIEQLSVAQHSWHGVSKISGQHDCAKDTSQKITSPVCSTPIGDEAAEQLMALFLCWSSFTASELLLAERRILSADILVIGDMMDELYQAVCVCDEQLHVNGRIYIE